MTAFVGISVHAQEEGGYSYCRDISKNGTSHAAELENACEFVMSLPHRLPNLICEETIKRYTSGIYRPTKLRDTITATVTHTEDGQQYSNVKIDGQPVEAKMSELSGAWSSGDFAGPLGVLFNPRSATQFKFDKEAELGSTAILLFNFRIRKQDNQAWSLVTPKETVYTGLEGKLWLAKADGRIVRLEVRTFDVPGDFLLQTVTMNLMYENVHLGDESYFVLPTNVETAYLGQAQLRFSNLITFRNCHKFASKSRIIVPPEQ